MAGTRRGPAAAGKPGGPRKPSGTKSDARRTAPSRGTLDAVARRLVNYQSRLSPDTDEDIHFRATQTLVLAARRWRKVANSRVAALGQTMARWETLYLVAFSNETLSQGELAQLLGVEGPTMARMLDGLARDGLIARRRRAGDKRVTVNGATPKGVQVVARIMDITNRLRADLLRDIDPKDLALCMDVLSRILRRLDEIG